MMVWVPALTATARQEVDPERSTITVRVSKAGLFRAFGDNHEIQAPIKSGAVEIEPAAAVHIVVDAQRMRVLDPALSQDNRAEVQARMLGPDVLDVNRFPEIQFQSTSVDQTQTDRWTVHGQLTLHGQMRPIAVNVVRTQGHFKGTASFKQSAFGITPVSVAGGTVKVKDEVLIEFDVVTRAHETPHR